MTFLQHLRLAAAASMIAAVLPACAQFNGPAVVAGARSTSPAPPTTDTSLLFPPARDLVIATQDLVAVHLFGQLEYSPIVRVGNDGSVVLPLIGSVAVAGLSVEAAERRIEERLQSAGMYKNPQITLDVTAGPNAVVTIIGEAHGVIPVTGTRRLLDVLAASGGLPATASHVVTINRPGVQQPIVVDLGTDPARSALANIPVFAGDTIIVSRVGVVYVVGSFKTQGIIPLAQNTPLTLIEAAALSGGATFDAKNSDLHLIRTAGNGRTVSRIDLQRVLRGKDADPILQADDILFMPDSLVKGAVANGTINTVISLATLAITTIELHNVH